MRKRIGNNIDDTVSELKESYKKIDDAYDMVKDLISQLQNCKWEGKSKRSLMALLELCKEFHKELKEMNNDNKKVMKTLADDTEDFMNNSSYANMWR